MSGFEDYKFLLTAVLVLIIVNSDELLKKETTKRFFIKFGGYVYSVFYVFIVDSYEDDYNERFKNLKIAYDELTEDFDVYELFHELFMFNYFDNLNIEVLSAFDEIINEYTNHENIEDISVDRVESNLRIIVKFIDKKLNIYSRDAKLLALYSRSDFEEVKQDFISSLLEENDYFFKKYHLELD